MPSLKSLAQLCAESYSRHTIDAGATEAICEVIDGVPHVAVRGSQTTRDWVRNLDTRLGIDPYLGGVHRGFLVAAEELWNCSEFVIWRSANLRDDGPIYLTGHSQGGAVATLLAHWLARDSPFVRLATFGSPRVLSAPAAERYSWVESHVRVVHRDDLVPHVPSWRYAHVGTPVYLNTSELGRDIRTLPAAISEHLARGGILGWWNRGWDDHDISHYVEHSSDTEWP